MSRTTHTPSVGDRQAQFARLSDSRKRALRREARQFIAQNPGSADASIHWRALSARQILAA